MGAFTPFTAIISGLIAYLLGSISSAVIISKLYYQDDVRNHASGNAGATNMSRTFGAKPGLSTLLCDFVKTALAMLIGGALAGEWGRFIAFLFCFAGHCWPVFFGFRGGKGVSVCFSAALFFDFRLFLIMGAVFLLVFFLCRIVSVSSMLGMLAMIPGAVLLGHFGGPVFFASVFAFVAVVWAHRANIGRLLRGEESKFSFKK